MLGREEGTPIDLIYETLISTKEIPGNQWSWQFEEQMYICLKKQGKMPMKSCFDKNLCMTIRSMTMARQHQNIKARLELDDSRIRFSCDGNVLMIMHTTDKQSI